MADLGVAADIFDKLIGAGISVIYLLILLAFVGYAYLSGLLAWRPYKVYVWVKKANGAIQLEKASGRNLKGGKFEVFYGLNDKAVMEAPAEDKFGTDKVLHLLRESRDAHFPLSLDVNSEKVTADPSWSNASKLALAQELKNNAHRFANDPWQKYAVPMSILLGFLIVGIAWYLSTGEIASQLNAVASNFAGVADALKDAQVVLEKAPEAPPG